MTTYDKPTLTHYVVSLDSNRNHTQDFKNLDEALECALDFRKANGPDGDGKDGSRFHAPDPNKIKEVSIQVEAIWAYPDGDEREGHPDTGQWDMIDWEKLLGIENVICSVYYKRHDEATGKWRYFDKGIEIKGARVRKVLDYKHNKWDTKGWSDMLSLRACDLMKFASFYERETMKACFHANGRDETKIDFEDYLEERFSEGEGWYDDNDHKFIGKNNDEVLSYHADYDLIVLRELPGFTYDGKLWFWINGQGYSELL
jgi:hypothetical protein